MCFTPMPYVIINGAGYTNYDNNGNLVGVGGISTNNFAPTTTNPYVRVNSNPKDGDAIVPNPGSTPGTTCTQNFYTQNSQGLVYIPQTNAAITTTQPIPAGYQVTRGKLANGAPSPYSFVAKLTPS